MAELFAATAEEIALGIRLRRWSAAEVIDAHLARIRARKGDLNAVVLVDEEGARRRAAEADRALAHGECWGPLHGVPVTIKDSLSTAGLRTTSGFPPLADYVPQRDATAVARIPRAGAVILGKTNLPANILFKDKIKAAADPVAERARLAADYRQRFNNPYHAASAGYVDDIIEPRETRPKVIAALSALRDKYTPAPPRKHGNIPV